MMTGQEAVGATALLMTGFLPFAIIGIFLAIGNYFLAKRLDANRFLWVILSIIPVVNFIFLYYLIYRVSFAILDRLNWIIKNVK